MAVLHPVALQQLSSYMFVIRNRTGTRGCSAAAHSSARRAPYAHYLLVFLFQFNENSSFSNSTLSRHVALQDRLLCRVV